MNHRRLAALVLGTLVAATAHAESLSIKPGIWKTTTRMTTPFGGGEQTRTAEECVKDTEFDPATMLQDADGCELTRSDVDGNQLDFGMECEMEGAQATMSGVFETDGDTGSGNMTMNMNMQGMSMEMKMSWTSERLGDC